MFMDMKVRELAGFRMAFEGEVFSRGSTSVWYDGWFIPRFNCFDKFSAFKPHEIIFSLVDSGVTDFHDYIKGNFTLVVIRDFDVTIMTDFHSLSKVYYRLNSEVKEYSNSYQSLITSSDHEDRLYPAVLALFQHPVAGRLPHENLRFVESPSYIVFSKQDITSRCYWRPPDDSLTASESVSTRSLVNAFSKVVHDVSQYLGHKECVLTLTGGRDTRSVLAALMKNGVEARTFTFGFPSGKDVIVSNALADNLGLKFLNPRIDPLSAENYNDWVSKLISYADPFIHIHRAHRLQAYKEVAEKFPEIGFMWMGCMGGDYSKGVSFNDYIVSSFLRLYYSGVISVEDCIRRVLIEHDFILVEEEVQALVKLVSEIDWLEDKWSKSAEMKLAYHFVGSLHDVQDMLLAKYCGYEVYSPFMDIDFLELQLKSEFNLFHAMRNTRNPLMRLKGGELQAHIICSLWPQLGNLPLANDYKPKDILGNRVIYFVKRLYRQMMKKPNLPTFSYGTWFVDWVKNKCLVLGREDFTVNSDSSFSSKEGSWHWITNKIWMDLFKREIDVRNSEK
jgi:hypothetical protein